MYLNRILFKKKSFSLSFTYRKSSFLYFEESTDFPCLYPHDFTEYVILVPNDRIIQSAIMDKLLVSPLFTVWASTICLFTIIRICMRHLLKRHCKIHASRNDYAYIFFNTFVLSFGTTSAHGVYTHAEMIVVLIISIFCIVAGNLCTGFLFERLTALNSVPAINSFHELLANPALKLVRTRIHGLRGAVFTDNS